MSDESLAAMRGECQRAWPGVSISAEAFSTTMAARLPSAHVTDLYLALGCSLHDPVALAHFERVLMPQVESYISKIDASAAFAEEVQQRIRQVLFVSDGASPAKISQYSGASALAAWLRVVAVRTARNAVRRQKTQVAIDGDEGQQLLAQQSDPELGYLKARYRDELNEAFRVSLQSLDPKEKNVMTLTYLDGLSSSAVGRVYGVQGATVRLWLKATREKLFEQTTQYLIERLGIPAAEVDSVIGLVQSQLNVTMSRLLNPR